MGFICAIPSSKIILLSWFVTMPLLVLGTTAFILNERLSFKFIPWLVIWLFILFPKWFTSILYLFSFSFMVLYVYFRLRLSFIMSTLVVKLVFTVNILIIRLSVWVIFRVSFEDIIFINTLKIFVAN